MSMNEQELRELLTGIGCIMEDARVTALVWKRDDKRSILDRAFVQSSKAADEKRRIYKIRRLLVRPKIEYH